MTMCTRQMGYAMNGAAEMPTDASGPIGYRSRASRNLTGMRRAGLLGLLAIWILSAPVLAAAEQVYYFHNDHLGTPQAMSDATGRKVWEAEYEPFGKAAVNVDPDGDGQVVVNNLRFPGQYYDAETGLHYNYFRDYDPATGRYLQPDPIGIDQGRNHLYVYAHDNPLSFSDPKGLADYYGLVNLIAAGEIGGGATLWGPVRTVCRNGKYHEGLLTAFFGGFNGGVFPFKSTVFDLDVADSAPPPGDLNNMCGFASIASVSIIVRSRTHLVLGLAQGDGWGSHLGFDLGAIWMSGYSLVSNVQEKCCGGF